MTPRKERKSKATWPLAAEDTVLITLILACLVGLAAACDALGAQEQKERLVFTDEAMEELWQYRGAEPPVLCLEAARKRRVVLVHSIWPVGQECRGHGFLVFAQRELLPGLLPEARDVLTAVPRYWLVVVIHSLRKEDGGYYYRFSLAFRETNMPWLKTAEVRHE